VIFEAPADRDKKWESAFSSATERLAAAAPGETIHDYVAPASAESPSDSQHREFTAPEDNIPV
jgi:hypothetical protein